MSDDLLPNQRRFAELVYGVGYDAPKPAAAARMLAEGPGLLGGDPYLACAVGDRDAISAALASDPAWLTRRGGPFEMLPLIAVTFSSLVTLPGNQECFIECVRLLLDAGADPNSSWT